MCLSICLSVSLDVLVSHFSIDRELLTVQTPEGDAAAAKAIAKPSVYILKRQREGGGMVVIYIN